MSLGDVIVQREVTNEEARNAICALFGLSMNDVLIVNDLAELLIVDNDRQVLCYKWNVQLGQFHTVLSFHEGHFMHQPRIPLARKLSSLLNSECLISDDSANPYTMTLVTPTGSFRQVKLHTEGLDRSIYQVVPEENEETS